VAYFEALLKPYQQPGLTVAFWRSNEDGTPANGGTHDTKGVVGKTEEVAGPLTICSSRALHGTMNPCKWKGARWWVVALHPPVLTSEDKVGSLKRTFLADLGRCPFDK
jgi:hypothetical protein